MHLVPPDVQEQPSNGYIPSAAARIHLRLNHAARKKNQPGAVLAPVYLLQISFAARKGLPYRPTLKSTLHAYSV